MNAWCEYKFSVFMNFSRGFSQSTIKYASKDMKRLYFSIFPWKSLVSIWFWKNVVIGVDRHSEDICVYYPWLLGHWNSPVMLDVDHGTVYNQWGASVNIGEEQVLYGEHDRIPKVGEV